MRISLVSLKSLLQNNVAEIKFTRRIPKPGFPPTRRMLCTNSLALLNSVEGRIALNYKRAMKLPPYNPDAKNLMITWDIFMQDYRNVSMNACDLLNTIPITNFWKFFNEKLALMDGRQKMLFMNS